MRDSTRPTALTLALAAQPLLQALHERIQRRDRSLADQLRRSSTSIALNLGEADGNAAGNRRQRLLSAMGSCRETRTALAVAVAWRHVGPEAVVPVEALLDRVCAMTWRRLQRC